MNKRLQIILFYIFFLLTTSCISDNNKIATLSDMQCDNSFVEYAYIFPDPLLSRTPDRLLPNEPWQIEASLPGEILEDYHLIRGYGLQVMFARIYNKNPEIWLSVPSRVRKENTKSVLIYQPTSKEWHYVSDMIEGTDIFVGEIFLTNDGTIWGLNKWQTNDTNPKKGPILSKFNEQTRQFEFASGALEVPFTDEQRFESLELVIDRQDNIFWFLLGNDGIYRYDPVTQATTKQIDLSNITLAWATVSTDGSIYFADFNKLPLADPPNSLPRGMLFHFVSDTKELTQLDIPEDPWPKGRMYVTEAGDLWIGANGYKDITNNWHLLHPDMDFYLNLTWRRVNSPYIILESSNGLLWFNKYTETTQGTAWYDPKTQEGCMITDISARIIEDEQQQLWMFAGGNLYRYSLNE